MTKDTSNSTFHFASTDKTLRNILETFAKAPGSVVFMTDMNGKYTYLDGPGLVYLGIDPKQWLGCSIFDFLKGLPSQRKIIEQVFKGKVFFDKSRFGEHHFEDRLFPILGPDDQILGIAGIQVCVTDKILAEQNLQASNELLDNLFDSIPDNAYLLDHHFNVLRVNAAVQSMFPDLPLVGTPCFRTIHHRDTPCEFCPVVETYETGKPARREYFEKKFNRFYELTSFPIRNQNTGEIIGATELARDITDRKRMEETLLRNEALLNDLLEVLDEGVYLIDTNYTITRVNKAMSEMYPDLAPLVGKKCYETTRYDCVCPDCAAECMFKEGKSTSRTFFEKNSDDVPGVWLELTVFPLYENGSDVISGAICILRDVTPRIELESRLDDYRLQIQAMAERQMHELRLNEAKLRSILDTCGAAISFADHRGRYTYINGKFKDMFGYSLEDLSGKKVITLLNPDSSRCREGSEMVDQTLRGDIDSFRGIFELEAKDGHRLWGDISVNTVRGFQPEDTQLISVILDVTAQQQLVEQLNRARISAEEASQEKSQFLAHMSHEIRTPLNGVIGLSDLLIGTSLNEKQQEYVHLINDSGKSLLFLINDILDFSKIEAGKLEIDSEPFDLPATVESVLGILASRAVGKNLELGITFCPWIPKIVQGDSGRIRQILLNLAGNAVKFTDRGGVRISVDIESIGQTDVLFRFTVEDTGIGIPTDRINRLFKAFSQADASSARVYGGTGLGLAISMNLVHLMGGEIGVESRENQGSTFWFNLPLGCDPVTIRCIKNRGIDCHPPQNDLCPNIDGDFCVAFAHRSIGNQYDLSGYRTLIIDDNEIQRETIRNQLTNWGLKCRTCSSGAEAVKLLEQERQRQCKFDLFVVDSTLADGTVFDCVQNLLRHREEHVVDIPKLILLRPLSEEYEVDFLRRNDAESVSKPVFSSALFDAVMNQLFTAGKWQGAANDTPFLRKSRSLDNRLKRSYPSNALVKSHLAGKIHALVVEDNRVNQIVARNLLSEAGFTCDIAINGFEACDAVRKMHYDVVLMDCQMPEMDGYEATDLIRTWEREHARKRIPIIALTANATKDDVQKCLDSGMDAYCSKPINPETMIHLIEEWSVKGNG